MPQHSVSATYPIATSIDLLVKSSSNKYITEAAPVNERLMFQAWEFLVFEKASLFRCACSASLASQLWGMKDLLAQPDKEYLSESLDGRLMRLFSPELTSEDKQAAIAQYAAEIKQLKASGLEMIFTCQLLTQETLFNSNEMKAVYQQLTPEEIKWLQERVLCLGGLVKHEELSVYLRKIISGKETLFDPSVGLNDSWKSDRRLESKLIETLETMLAKSLVDYKADYFRGLATNLLVSTELPEFMKSIAIVEVLETQFASNFPGKPVAAAFIAAYALFAARDIDVFTKEIILKETLLIQKKHFLTLNVAENAEAQVDAVYRFIATCNNFLKERNRLQFQEWQKELYSYLTDEVLLPEAVEILDAGLYPLTPRENNLARRMRLLDFSQESKAICFENKALKLYCYMHSQGNYDLGRNPDRLLKKQEALYEKLIAARAFTKEEAVKLRGSTVRVQLQNLAKQQAALIAKRRRAAIKNNRFVVLDGGVDLAFLFCDVDGTLIRSNGTFNGGEQTHFQQLFADLNKAGVCVTGMTARADYCGSTEEKNVFNEAGQFVRKELVDLQVYLGLQEQFNQVMTYLGGSMPKARAVVLFTKMLLAELDSLGVEVNKIEIGVWDDNEVTELVHQEEIDRLIAEDDQLCNRLKVKLIAAPDLPYCESYEDFKAQASVEELQDWALAAVSDDLELDDGRAANEVEVVVDYGSDGYEPLVVPDNEQLGRVSPISTGWASPVFLGSSPEPDSRMVAPTPKPAVTSPVAMFGGGVFAAVQGAMPARPASPAPRLTD
jgi:hypothetical protein